MNTAGRRARQAKMGYKHISGMKRPIYRKVTAEKAANRLMKSIETENRIRNAKSALDGRLQRPYLLRQPSGQRLCVRPESVTSPTKEKIMFKENSPLSAALSDGAPMTDADPSDPVAMAPHVEHMKKMIDVATGNPGDYFYSVVIMPKDGGTPVVHGTTNGPMLTLIGMVITDPFAQLILLQGLAEYDPEAMLLNLAANQAFPDTDDGDDEGWNDDSMWEMNDPLGSVLGSITAIVPVDAEAQDNEADADLHRLADDGNPHQKD